MRPTSMRDRYGTMDPSVLERLTVSRVEAENSEKREIKCPICGFYLMDVYGREHYIARVKCRKCKFNEPIDTALFRTVKFKRKGLCCNITGRKQIR